MLNNTLHMAAQTYQNLDFTYGPIADNYKLPEYELKYNRLWKISQQEIDNHIANYSDASYVMPPSIAEWPGNGNMNNGEMFVLAPYEDVNNNGIYDPENGDYPIIRGDQAVFFMFNDENIEHASGGEKMRIQVNAMAYAYDAPADSALNQTVFVNFEIFNLSNNNYTDVYLGSFVDFDLGDANDDLTGCDTILKMMYAYNATNVDAQYGISPPAQGAILLNHNLSKFMAIYTQTAPFNFPENAVLYYNHLQGLWSDGTPITYGGTGHGGTTPTDFMFSGYPENNEGWTEIGEQVTPYDIKGVMSKGPFTFNSGDLLCLDLAFPFARDYSGTNLTSLALLRQRAQTIQTHYDNQSYDCIRSTLSLNKPDMSSLNVNVYPNPSKGLVNIHISETTPDMQIEIYSLLGQKIHKAKLSSELTSIDLSHYSGFFVYVIKDSGIMKAHGKIIIK